MSEDLWRTIVQNARVVKSMDDSIEHSGMPMTDQMARRLAASGIRLAKRVLSLEQERRSAMDEAR